MPLPLTVSCFSKIQIGLTFLGWAYPGNPGQNPESRKTAVCVCARVVWMAFWVYFKNINVFDSCMKSWQYFRTDNMSTESYLFFFLEMYFVTRSKLAFTRNLLKCNNDFMKKSRLSATWREVNVAIATIALPVAWFLHGLAELALYNKMVLASQLGYFRLVCGKI